MRIRIRAIKESAFYITDFSRGNKANREGTIDIRIRKSLLGNSRLISHCSASTDPFGDSIAAEMPLMPDCRGIPNLLDFNMPLFTLCARLLSIFGLL